MTFQHVSELAPGQQGIVDLVSIILSPQNFKGFIRAATEVLKAYEASFGQLTITDEDTKPLKSAAELEAAVRGIRMSSRTAET